MNIRISKWISAPTKDAVNVDIALCVFEFTLYLNLLRRTVTYAQEHIEESQTL